MGDGMAWTGWEEWLEYSWVIDYGYMGNQGLDCLRLGVASVSMEHGGSFGLGCWYVCLKGQG